MKNKFIVPIILLFALASCRTEDPAIPFLKQFYNAYFDTCDKDPPQEGVNMMNSLVQKNCTKKMQKQFNDPEIDWDLFLDAQYCQTAWKQTLKIIKGKSEGEYVVTFNVSPIHEVKTIRLKVIKESGSYKIDEVIR